MDVCGVRLDESPDPVGHMLSREWGWGVGR